MLRVYLPFGLGISMKRCITALLAAASLIVSTPSESQAGVIPWTYNAVFGYGPVFGWRQAYYGGQTPFYTGYGAGYGAGYAAPYSSYSMPYYGGGVINPACPGGNCGVIANYGPDIYGCCAPINPCCNTCVGGCDPGCTGPNCAGCGTGTPPADSSTGSSSEKTPTYAPPTNQPGSSTPMDDFEAAERQMRQREQGNAGTPQQPPASGINRGAPPTFEKPADVEPSESDANRDLGTSPRVKPLDSNAKVAYRTPAEFRRVHAEAKFRQPTVVRVTPLTPKTPGEAPTAVASK